MQIWDVLSNKEVVDIVGSCPTRSYAARTLVESAVRAWRSKYPTSKVDDCAVVCLFLDSNESAASTTKFKENIPSPEEDGVPGVTGLNRSGTVRSGEGNEEVSDGEQMYTEVGQEWSALEGVSRVNTLLTLPRFVPGEEDIKAAGGREARK